MYFIFTNDFNHILIFFNVYDFVYKKILKIDCIYLTVKHWYLNKKIKNVLIKRHYIFIYYALLNVLRKWTDCQNISHLTLAASLTNRNNQYLILNENIIPWSFLRKLLRIEENQLPRRILSKWRHIRDKS